MIDLSIKPGDMIEIHDECFLRAPKSGDGIVLLKRGVVGLVIWYGIPKWDSDTNNHFLPIKRDAPYALVLCDQRVGYVFQRRIQKLKTHETW